MKKNYCTRDRKTEKVIDSFDTYDEAKEAINRYYSPGMTELKYPFFGNSDEKYEIAVLDADGDYVTSFDEWTEKWIKVLEKKGDELNQEFIAENCFGEYGKKRMTGRQYNKMLRQEVAERKPTTDEDFEQCIPWAYTEEEMEE